MTSKQRLFDHPFSGAGSSIANVEPWLELDVAVLRRLVYKNHSQHRRAKHFQLLKTIVRKHESTLAQPPSLALSSTSYPSLTSTPRLRIPASHCAAYLTRCGLLALQMQRISRCVVQLRSVLGRAYFLPFGVTVLFAVSRLMIGYALLYIRTVSQCWALETDEKGSSHDLPVMVRSWVHHHTLKNAEQTGVTDRACVSKEKGNCGADCDAVAGRFTALLTEVSDLAHPSAYPLPAGKRSDASRGDERKSAKTDAIPRDGSEMCAVSAAAVKATVQLAVCVLQMWETHHHAVAPLPHSPTTHHDAGVCTCRWREKGTDGTDSFTHEDRLWAYLQSPAHAWLSSRLRRLLATRQWVITVGARLSSLQRNTSSGALGRSSNSNELREPLTKPCGVQNDGGMSNASPRSGGLAWWEGGESPEESPSRSVDRHATANSREVTRIVVGKGGGGDGWWMLPAPACARASPTSTVYAHKFHQQLARLVVAVGGSHSKRCMWHSVMCGCTCQTCANDEVSSRAATPAMLGATSPPHAHSLLKTGPSCSCDGDKSWVRARAKLLCDAVLCHDGDVGASSCAVHDAECAVSALCVISGLINGVYQWSSAQAQTSHLSQSRDDTRDTISYHRLAEPVRKNAKENCAPERKMSRANVDGGITSKRSQRSSLFLAHDTFTVGLWQALRSLHEWDLQHDARLFAAAGGNGVNSRVHRGVEEVPQCEFVPPNPPTPHRPGSSRAMEGLVRAMCRVGLFRAHDGGCREWRSRDKLCTVECLIRVHGIAKVFDTFMLVLHGHSGGSGVSGPTGDSRRCPLRRHAWRLFHALRRLVRCSWQPQITQYHSTECANEEHSSSQEFLSLDTRRSTHSKNTTDRILRVCRGGGTCRVLQGCDGLSLASDRPDGVHSLPSSVESGTCDKQDAGSNTLTAGAEPSVTAVAGIAAELSSDDEESRGDRTVAPPNTRKGHTGVKNAKRNSDNAHHTTSSPVDGSETAQMDGAAQMDGTRSHESGIRAAESKHSAVTGTHSGSRLRPTHQKPTLSSPGARETLVVEVSSASGKKRSRGREPSGAAVQVKKRKKSKRSRKPVDPWAVSAGGETVRKRRKQKKKKDRKTRRDKTADDEMDAIFG